MTSKAAEWAAVYGGLRPHFADGLLAAHVTDEGNLALESGGTTYDAKQALALAAWLTATFSDTVTP